MEYKVAELREGLIGGEMSSKKLEKELNRYAADDCRYTSMTSLR
ncbi:DUF4177 domain-containing protein [uncultured Corynebacterium sp.]|nr:DUF4177 domain-containing protein [uncultured Corynebacterium sp.]